MSRALAIVLLTAALATAQQKKPVTIESLPSGPADTFCCVFWSPDGKKFLTRHGQALMLYDTESKSERELLALPSLDARAVAPEPATAMDWENRRVAEQPFQWAKSGKAILITYKGDLFLWTEGGEVRQLTSTAVAERDAKLSPDGTKVSFRIDHDLYALDVESKKMTRLTRDGSDTIWNGMLDWVYPEELELGTAHWWSPDSKSIAYLQFDVSREPFYPHMDHLPVAPVGEPQRYPKAGTPNADVRVGVVSASGGMTKWLEFGETRDHLTARVAWTPKSDAVTVHRLNRVQNKLEILSTSVESNQMKTLVRELDPAWINLTDDFNYLSNGDFLLTSERDGFRHIYYYDADGKLKGQLTRGDWEVSEITCVDEAGKKIYYMGTEKTPLERHLYVVGFNGKGKQQITKGDGTHRISMSKPCGSYLDTFTSLDTPARHTLHTADGSETAVYREARRKDAEEFQILKTEMVTFTGKDGARYYARMIKPPNFDPKRKYPAIVFVYGGPHAQSVRNVYAGLTWDQALAHRGFVIWQMDNRGSAARGHQWEAKLYRRLGQQELSDQKEGVQHLVSLGFVDPRRVGIYGWSYGGYMTLYALLHAPEVFAAGVAGAAPTDWRNYDTIYTERYLGLPQENEEGYKLSSPVHAAANLKGKLLLIHNIGDDNVLFANALQMSNALQLANKKFDMQIYPQKSHAVSGKARRHMLETATEFFVEALQTESPAAH